SDDTRELLGQPGVLVCITDVHDDTVTVDPAGLTLRRSDFPKNPKARAWDMLSGAMPATPGTWIPLEDGVEVWFDGASCQTGDYWLIPARSATRDIEWLRDAQGNPQLMKCAGVRHRYAALAILQATATALTVARDRRIIFPALANLRNVDPD